MTTLVARKHNNHKAFISGANAQYSLKAFGGHAPLLDNVQICNTLRLQVH